MAIASITSDYTGRKKDISILQYPSPLNSPSSVTTSDFYQLLASPSAVFPKFGKSTRFCAGVQKLVQRYVVLLLTDIGSQPNYQEFGTELLKTLLAGISPVDTVAASQLFNLASYSAVENLKIYQTLRTDIPADERIASVSLEDIVLSGGVASFSVLLKTDAGSSVDFLVPLPK